MFDNVLSLKESTLLGHCEVPLERSSSSRKTLYWRFHCNTHMNTFQHTREAHTHAHTHMYAHTHNTVEPHPMGLAPVHISEAIHFQWKLYIMYGRNLMNIINLMLFGVCIIRAAR